MNEQPVGVDPVGSTGHERAEVVVGVDSERGDLVGLHDLRVRYPIGVRLGKRPDDERSTDNYRATPSQQDSHIPQGATLHDQNP